MSELNELKSGSRVRGQEAATDATIVAVEPHGDGMVKVVYRGDDGSISARRLTAQQAAASRLRRGAKGQEFE